MDSRILRAEVTDQAFDPESLLTLVTRPSDGGCVLFVGRVRDHDPQADGPVSGLDYSSHPSAPDRIVEIVSQVVAELDPGRDCQVAAVHRIGYLGVGDPAFVVAVAAPHRRLAFDVCDQLVEDCKAQLPIWKQQFQADGTYGWSGL
jgi:molybdopterin synthase catalytic subunit